MCQAHKLNCTMRKCHMLSQRLFQPNMCFKKFFVYLTSTYIVHFKMLHIPQKLNIVYLNQEKNPERFSQANKTLRNRVSDKNDFAMDEI